MKKLHKGWVPVALIATLVVGIFWACPVYAQAVSVEEEIATEAIAAGETTATAGENTLGLGLGGIGAAGRTPRYAPAVAQTGDGTAFIPLLLIGLAALALGVWLLYVRFHKRG